MNASSDRILGAVCLAAAAAMGWAALDYAAVISYEPVGPRAFPLLLAVLIGLCGAWLVARPSAHSAAVAPGRMGPLLACMAAIVMYALLFETLGFTVATTLLAVPVGMAFGGTWRQSLLGGLALGVGLYIFLDKLLDVVLPTGVLSFFLGR
jgi:putative tricarboxylic transport membrane protein